MAETIRVQVAYAHPDTVFLRDLSMEQGSSVRQALVLSGLLAEVPGIDIETASVGLHGKQKTLDTVLREGDRVEVYRPLLADPKDARRRRAVKQKREAAGR